MQRCIIDETYIVENHRNIFKKIDEPKCYMVKLEKFSEVKAKFYPSGGELGKNDQRLIDFNYLY